MDAEIRTYVSRYVVPFYYEEKNDSYKKIYEFFLNNHCDYQMLGMPNDVKWIEAGFWENYKSDKSIQAEMDLYSYLPSVFLTDSDGGVQNLGTSFVLKTGGKIFELEYQKNDQRIPFVCKDMGVLLFKTGIGFVWYEVEFKKSLNICEYVEFQNSFKELARTQEDIFVRKIGFDKEKKKSIYESFCLGKWLAQILSSRELKISFWAERVSASKGEKVCIPDKALLFQYLFIEPLTKEKRDALIFRVTNGYDEKYSVPDGFESNLYMPFANSSFYISKAGMSCVVTNSESNEVFFETGFRERYIRDYFFIFLLLSFQSYSCAHYSRLLTGLPANEKAFDKKISYYNMLEKLSEKINLFLVKSIFDSISNVQHQNGVYRYGKEALCIESDIQSLTIGLDALKELESEKKNGKVELALVIFGFMVVVSALLDGLNLVDWFRDNIGSFSLMHMGVSAFIILLTVYLIFVLLWSNRKGK